MERDGRDLEAEPDREQSHAEQDQRIRTQAIGAHGRGDERQVGQAGPAVDQRDTEQEECARERAQQEILDGTLAGAEVPAVRAGEHVDRHGHQLEADEDHHQVARSGEHHHPDGGQQHQHVQLAEPQVRLVEVARRDQHEESRAEQQDEIHEHAERIERNDPGRAGILERQQPAVRGAREQQADQRQAGNPRAGWLAAAALLENIEQEQAHRPE